MTAPFYFCLHPFCFHELSKDNHSFNTTEGALLFLNNYYTLTIETANYFVRELNLKRNSPYGGRERRRKNLNLKIVYNLQ